MVLEVGASVDGYIWRAYRKLNTLKWALRGLADSATQPQTDDIFQLLIMANEIEKDLREVLHSGTVSNCPREEADP